MTSCPRCQRANPREAVYCHFDGAELRPIHGSAGSLPPTHLPRPFVFPGGRQCRTYDQFLRGCQEEWDEAREMLGNGTFAQFFAGAGRPDLVRCAAEAREQEDADVALDVFVANLSMQLPVGRLERPRLELRPRRVQLSGLRSGEEREVPLRVLNQGQGLLHGSLSLSEGKDWLQVEGANASGECRIKTTDEQVFMIRVDGRQLAAGHNYRAKLTLITNGGIVEVPIRVEVAAQPFPKPPFQAAGNPRELAERMRSHPKAAVPLLESGEVARWFASNGWTYPVRGPTVPGVAAVQQFFEGMGLARPPAVHLSPTLLQLGGHPDDDLRGELILETPARKWIYGQVETDAAWLQLVTPNVSGPQRAVIGLTVATDQLEPGRTHTGTLQVIANGGQRLWARVRVELQPAGRSFLGRVGRGVLIGAVLGLLVRLVLAVPADLHARWLAAPAGTFGGWHEVAFDPAFLRRFVEATWWLGGVGGMILLWRRRTHWADAPCGLVAGAAAGLAGSASLACLVPLLDEVPRRLWGLSPLHERNLPASVEMAVWVLVAVSAWTMLGAAIGLGLGCLGRPGARLLTVMVRPLAWLLSCCGWRRAAAWLMVR